MITKAFAETLRQQRIDSGWSQEELGFRSELHRTYISQLERGIKTPTLETVHRIASALGLSVADLMQLVESRMESAAVGSKSPKAHSRRTP